MRVPAALWHAGTALRGTLYDRGWLPILRLDVPVISVGNVTTGGTGKTPLVEWVARSLVQRGRRPGLLSRGYGARAGTDGANDEAAMLARTLPGVPHEADPDRFAGGLRLQESGIDVVVLDDGFQHRRLHRDVDLVTVDALRPWGLPREPNGSGVRALLPRGFLREAPAALARADALIVTRSDQVSESELERLALELHRFAPAAPILSACHAVRGLRTGEERAPIESLRGREVVLVSGIGNPDAFEATVRGAGMLVREHRRFPDHHAYGQDDVAGFAGLELPLLTTAKDAVKLEALGVAATSVEIGLEFRSGESILGALLDSLPVGAREKRRRGLHEGLHG